MRVGERDFGWTFCSWQLEMVFRCITERGTNPGKLPCNPTNHQQMTLLATRQDSGILACSVAEFEPGTEVETFRPKAYTLQVVYSRQMGKACLVQTLVREGSHKEQMGFWVTVPPSYQTVVPTIQRGMLVSLSSGLGYDPSQN